MAIAENHILNLTYFENRLGELDLKNWWVAEYVGVDRKTVTRWLSGKVKTIKYENLQALASCLKCTAEELVLKDEASIVASKEEQALAAQLIVQENLQATLTPLWQWPLLESIVKATMQPNLPLPIMGKLYNLLSTCAWRQGDMDKASGFATKALQIGKQIGHRGVIVQAKNNFATIYSFQGRIPESISMSERVQAERSFIDDEKSVANSISNCAQDYQVYGDFEKSRQLHLEAIEIYKKLSLPLNISIAYCGLGLLEIELKYFDQAKKMFLKSLNFAKKAGHRRGIHAAKVYLADVYSHQGDFAKAEVLLKEGIAGFKELKIEESLNYEVASRLNRMQNKFTQAETLLIDGLRHAKHYPVETAQVYVEFAMLAKAKGDLDRYSSYKQQAIEIYEKCGATLRVQKLRTTGL